MSALKKHHKLYKEHPDHYEIIDTRDNKTFPVAKRHLTLAMHKELSKIQKFDEGGEAQGDQGGDQPPVTVNVNSGAQPVPAVVAAPQPVVTGQAPVAPAVPQAPVISAPPPMPNGQDLVKQAKSNEAFGEKAIQEGANASSMENELNAKTYQDNLDKMKKVMEGYQTSRAKIDAENDALTKAVLDTKIDPRRYFNDMSLPGKISSAIGVILGGIGAGLQHSTINQAQAVIDNNIKNDIESQKAELGKKQTLLSMNMEKYKNLDAATAATYQQMNAMVDGQIKLSAAKNGSARANAIADQAIAERRAKYLAELPALATQQFKISALNELSGGEPVPSAAEKILGPAQPAATGQGVGLPGARQPNAAPGQAAPAQGAPGQLTPPTVDPGLTPGSVDTKKLMALKIGEVLKGDDANEVNKQIAGLVQNHAAKAEIKNEFDRMEKAIAATAKIQNGPMDASSLLPQGVSAARAKEVLEQLPWVGNAIAEAAPWGDQPGREFDAARKGAENTINRLLTKRIGGEGLKNIKAGLPTGQETPDERKEMLKRVYDALDKTVDTNLLDQYGLIRKAR